MSTIHRLWQGEVPLPQAFWRGAVLGGLAVNGTTSLLFLVLLLNGQVTAAFVAGYVLSVPYNVFISVAVWRSAGRYRGERHWADLARAVTVVGMTLLSIT